MFSYFIPGDVVQPTTQYIFEKGIGYAFSGNDFAHCPLPNQTGPDGKSGVIVARDHTFATYHKNQVWETIAGNESGVMIGYPKGRLPQPAELIRPSKNQTCPATIPLEINGLHWQLPIVRYYDENASELVAIERFETVAAFDGQTWQPGRVVDRQADCKALADEVVALFADSSNVNFGAAEQFLIATRILQTAYFLDNFELHLMGAYRFDRSALIILQTFIDFTGFITLKKKLAAGSANSKHGATE